MNNSTPFPGLVITNVVYLGSSFTGSRSFTVPNRIYGTGSERVASVEEALEILFRQLNHVDGSELISEPDFCAAWPHESLYMPQGQRSAYPRDPREHR